MGRQIKKGIIDSFDRKNEDTIEKMRNMVNEIGVCQNQLTIDVKSKLKDYRQEIETFKQEFYDKATKLEVKKAIEHMEDTRA